MASGGPRPCLGCSPSLALALRVADPSHSAALETMSHCHTVTGQSAIRVRLRVGWREISLHRRRAPRAGMARPSARPAAARACLRLRFPTFPTFPAPSFPAAHPPPICFRVSRPLAPGPSPAGGPPALGRAGGPAAFAAAGATRRPAAARGPGPARRLLRVGALARAWSPGSLP